MTQPARTDRERVYAMRANLFLHCRGACQGASLIGIFDWVF